jgi:hypothetical protein
LRDKPLVVGLYVKNSKILDRIRKYLVNRTSRSKVMDKKRRKNLAGFPQDIPYLACGARNIYNTAE